MGLRRYFNKKDWLSIDRPISAVNSIRRGIRLSVFFNKIMRLESSFITIFDLWEMMKGNEHHLIGKSILNLTKKLNQPELPKNFRITADIFIEKISIISDRGIEIVAYLDTGDINYHIIPEFVTYNLLDSRFVIIIPILESTPLKLGQSICHDIYWEDRRVWLYDYNHDTI